MKTFLVDEEKRNSILSWNPLIQRLQLYDKENIANHARVCVRVCMCVLVRVFKLAFRTSVTSLSRFCLAFFPPFRAHLRSVTPASERR